MKRHPLSQLFPELEGPDFRELVLDIKANGLHEDIVTLDGMVLDGWNRFRACSVAGIKPKLTQYIGDDPLAYVVSKNMARRHLTPTQRAEIAASIANTTHGGSDQGANLHLGIKPNNDAAKSNLITINQAAKMMNVSVRSVKIAKKLRAKSPALAKKVLSGDITLHAASKEAGIIKEKPKRGRPRKPASTPQPKPVANDSAAESTVPMTAKQLRVECDRICAAVADSDAEAFAQLVNDWLVKPLVNRNQKRNVSPYTR